MKILKKLIIISCFSLLFILNVNAEEFNDYAIAGYSEEQIPIIQNFKQSDKYTQIIDYIRNNLTNYYIFNNPYDLTDNSLILFDISTLNSNGILFHIYTKNDVMFNNGRNAALKLVNFYMSSRNSLGATFRANFSSNNLQNVTPISSGGKSMYFEIETTETNYFVYPKDSSSFNASYIDNTFVQDDYTVLFSISTPIYVDGNLYNGYGNYNLNDFVNYMNRNIDINYIPNISQPYTEQFNNYTNTIFKINNYSYNSIDVEGLRIDIINNNNGNREFVQPNSTGEEITITKTNYENTSYTIQLYDNDYNIIEEYSINANVMYYNDNFNVNIFNINNENKTIHYSYDINYEDDVYCYHIINSSNEILDSNCKNSDNNYQLTLNNNGNVQFVIKNSNNEILFRYNQNFVFDVSQPYINFIDKFENNFLTLDVIINRFNSSDVVRYSINNGEYFIVSYFENINLDVGDVRKFTISNLNNNDVIKVQILRNNIIISESSFNVFFNKYPEEENFNLKNFFNKIDISNISNDLREYIVNIGNIIINSKIGNLILLQFFILIITWVLKLIVN